MPLTLENMVGKQEAKQEDSLPTKNKGNWVGSIKVTVWSNSKPDYTFQGNIAGKNLKTITHHIKKAYILHQQGVRRAVVKEDG